MFAGIHVLLAERTNTPELAMGEDEAKQFMASAQNVLRHYSVKTTQKAMDWAAFIGMTVAMYTPRMVAISVRRSGQRQQQQGPGATVLHFVAPDIPSGSEHPPEGFTG